MLVLGIDTSTKICSVALFHNKEGIIAETNMLVNLNHSDTLVAIIHELLAKSGTNKKDIGKIAVGLGPGSYTGLRVGMGVAKGMAIALKVPIVGINTLDILAQGVAYSWNYVMPLIDARNNRVYYSLYSFEDGEIMPLEGYKDGKLEEIIKLHEDKNIIFTGNGSISYRKQIKELLEAKASFNELHNSCVRASILADMAVDVEPDNIDKLEPFYLSKSQAEKVKEQNSGK